MIAHRQDALTHPETGEAFVYNGHLKVFNHHVYEYRKGLRHLALQTLPSEHASWIIPRLEQLGIDYLIFQAGDRNINVFLGDPECLAVLRRIGKFDLSHYSPEEDFILGIMLGYGRRQQCLRYLAQVTQSRNRQTSLPESRTTDRSLRYPETGEVLSHET